MYLFQVCRGGGKWKCVTPLPEVVEVKKQHLEEQWEEVKGMRRVLELYYNTVSACGVGNNISLYNSLFTYSLCFFHSNN
jgi:hypothetical protein